MSNVSRAIVDYALYGRCIIDPEAHPEYLKQLSSSYEEPKVKFKGCLAINPENNESMFPRPTPLPLPRTTLHKSGVSHGDLQHGNIMVLPRGELRLVDYDSMYVPRMQNVPDEIKGIAGYQHPARSRQKYRSPNSDYFSELVIYTSIRMLASHPGLWRKYNLGDTETMLFTEADITSGGTSEIFRLIESDRDVRNLGRAVKDALRQPTLDRIVPLEEIVNGQSETIAEIISDRWRKQGYLFNPFQSNVDIFNQLADISSRW